MISTATDDDANSMMRSVVVELNLTLSNSIYPRYLIAFILVKQNTMSGGCCLLLENIQRIVVAKEQCILTVLTNKTPCAGYHYLLRTERSRASNNIIAKLLHIK